MSGLKSPDKNTVKSTFMKSYNIKDLAGLGVYHLCVKELYLVETQNCFFDKGVDGFVYSLRKIEAILSID